MRTSSGIEHEAEGAGPEAGRVDADVIVVGLGATGAATLWQLARRGVRVLGLERFTAPNAMGSSHGETRITRRATGEGEAYTPFVDASYALWRELEALSGERLFVESGVLVVAPADGSASTHAMPDFLGRTRDIARAHGIAHETLDGAAIRTRFPVFAGAADTDAGYFEPGAGYLFPDRCIAAQLERARAHGATVREHVEVRALHTDAQGVTVETSAGDFHAGRVVVAAGAWSGDLLGAPFDTLLTVRRQVLHWFELAAPGAAVGAGVGAGADAFEGMPAFVWLHGPRDDDVFYGFPPMPGAGTIKVADEQYVTATRAEALARVVEPSESARMHAAHVAGRLAGVSSRAAASVACTYTLTPDHGFVIDAHPRLPGVDVVACCSGHGFKHSAGIGRAVAERIVDGAPAFVDLEPFSLARFGVRTEGASR